MTLAGFDALLLGTSGLGRDPSPEGADAAVRTAMALLARPGTLVDTSNAYADGRSEAALGEARRRLGSAARATVMTKAARDPETGALDRDRVLRSFEESRARLGVDTVPFLHLHDPYTISVRDAEAPGGAIAGLRELRDAGTVGAIGIAAGPIPLMTRYVETGAFDAVLTHNRCTLVDRSAAPLLQAARERGMTVFNAAPFGGGILVTGARDDATYAYRPAAPELRDWVHRVERVCAAYGVPLPAVALAFSLRSPLVDATVVGAGSPERLRRLEALRATPVPEAIWDEIDALGPAPSPIDDAHDPRGAA